MCLHGLRVLHRPRRDTRHRGDELARLPPRWQACHLGRLAQVSEPAPLSLLRERAHVGELERERHPLRGGELPPCERGEEHVLALVFRCDEPHRHPLESELASGAQARPPVEHDPRLRHLERAEEAAPGDVGAEACVLRGPSPARALPRAGAGALRSGATRSRARQESALGRARSCEFFVTGI